ncbi:AtpZ/AtpI family protein [Nitratireductor sp. CH_MIT9313-5]|uniref:AtpZ/AtpI family protein n=1 Tax=Nitratireductor sp. CH_MIT9313-5 TaxID=3107764 RepID=UPI00300A29B6
MANGEKPDDLDRRRKDLEAALAAKRPKPQAAESAKTGTMNGMGNALRLSSEFVAGVLVGAAIGWFIDEFAGTSPWGLIIFLLLGFGAGVLNVLRSAGLVAEFGARNVDDDSDRGAN